MTSSTATTAFHTLTYNFLWSGASWQDCLPRHWLFYCRIFYNRALIEASSTMPSLPIAMSAYEVEYMAAACSAIMATAHIRMAPIRHDIPGYKKGRNLSNAVPQQHPLSLLWLITMPQFRLPTRMANSQNPAHRTSLQLCMTRTARQNNPLTP